MSKLAESYIEFVAKGLEEVEKGIAGLDEGSRTAHRAVSFLSEQFKDFAKKNSTAIESTTLQQQAFRALSGEAGKLIIGAAKLKEAQAALSVEQATAYNALLKTNKGFAEAANSITNLAAKERLLGAENALLLTRMQSVDKEAIKLAAAEIKASQATDIATKKLQLEARQLNLTSGAFKEATKAAAELEKMEAKLQAREAKTVAKVTGKKAAPQGGEVGIKMTGGPEAEKGIAAITSKLKGMQMAALVAGGAIAGSVGMLTRAASAGTVEGEQLAKSYEVAGKVIGDIFAPYVRLTTDLVNKLTQYWMTLSQATKASIAKWAMLTVGVVAFAAALPTVIAGIGAVVSILTALTGPIGLAGMAIAALIGYFAGVFDSTKSWEEVLATFIEFFLNTWSRAESAFDSFCSGVVAQYDSTVGPMLSAMEEGWTAASDAVGEVVSYLGETIAGFFGTSIEDASTFQGLMSSLAEAWLDFQTAAQAVIDMMTDGFIFIYDNAVKPTVDLIMGAFKMVWGYITEVAKSIFGAWTEATGGITDAVMGAVKFMFGSWKNFTATVVSLVFTIVETFATAVNKISELWWTMVNKLAKAAAWVMEKMGLISKDTADKMRQVGQGNTDIFDTEAMRKKMDGYLDNMVMGMEQNTAKAKEFGAAINDFVNAPAGPELAAKLEANGARAKNIAKTVTGMIKGLDKPGGFQVKGTMSFEGIGASFDRLQLAMANNAGVSIDKMQLGQMQQINQNMQIAAGALVNIKDKIPAVR